MHTWTALGSLFLVSSAALLALPADLGAQSPAAQGEVDIEEWEVEWGGRTRDPYVAPDGVVWFVGQEGNYVASFDPVGETFRRYEVEEGTNPHNLIVDADGYVWYSGNRNGRIGRLDPETGEAEIFMMPDPEIRDPHTLAFDAEGDLWFTAQGANRIGRLDVDSGEMEILEAYDSPARPYGIVIDDEGRPWVNLFNTNLIASVDPETMEITRYPIGPEDARSRRIARTPDGMIWYVDYARGYLGRLDPDTGETAEWMTPQGAGAYPYGLAADDRGRLWFAETGESPRLVGFDPETERFFSISEVSGTIRHMIFHEPSGALWFGTDANNIGRALVSPPAS